MLLLSINTIQHLNGIIPVYRLMGYKVSDQQGLDGSFRTGFASQNGSCHTVGWQQGTWGHPQGQSWPLNPIPDPTCLPQRVQEGFPN